MKKQFLGAFPMLSFIATLMFVTAVTSANAQSNSLFKGVERDLVLFGPAAGGLTGAGFAPRGRVIVFPLEDVQGADKLRVEIEGLPANTCFTIFLSELNDFPFGSLEYVADACTNHAGRGVVNTKLIVLDAFALKTDANGTPPAVFGTPINVDLNHIVLWFADSAADDSFTPVGFGAGPFDADRDAGTAVLRTEEPLP